MSIFLALSWYLVWLLGDIAITNDTEVKREGHAYVLDVLVVRAQQTPSRAFRLCARIRSP